jgi:transposase
MSKSRVIVLSVVQQGLTKSEAAKKFGVSWQWVHELVTRYERDGEAGLEPKSRRPHSNKNQTPPHLVQRVIQLRAELTRDGFDAGP